MDPTQHIYIEFSDESLLWLNICLGFIMFGIALGIKPEDFKSITRFPKSALAGIGSQFLLLPFFTFLLITAIEPSPAISLGMILVASCPGGNVSNYFSSISGANIALSVSLTAASTLLCPVLTPLNFDLWASLIPSARELLASFQIGFIDMLRTVLLLLVIPLIAGIFFARRFPLLTSKIQKPISITSFVILLVFIGLALSKNMEAFRDHLGLIFLIVLIHNAIALATGYFTGSLLKLPEGDRRTLTIETGIQNSGLGLIIIFTFFKGNGGMAIIAAWWGIWHIISGSIVAGVFRFADRKRAAHHT